MFQSNIHPSTLAALRRVQPSGKRWRLTSHTLILCPPLLGAHLSTELFTPSSGTRLPFKTPSPAVLRPRHWARNAASPSKRAGRCEVLAAGGFQGVKHEIMLRWRLSDLLERPGRDAPQLSSVTRPHRCSRRSLLMESTAAASCIRLDLPADVSPTDACPRKQDRGSVSCHGNGCCGRHAEVSWQNLPSGLVSLLPRAPEATGTPELFLPNFCDQLGGVPFRLIEQRTLGSNDFSTSRLGAVYLLKMRR